MADARVQRPFLSKIDLQGVRQGFTLVELAIVLVILGLLVGGVLSGQSLIKAAQLRSISTDLSRYHSAILTFRDKYFALPGDMTNATLFWNKDNAHCSGQPGVAATPGTCNGNGDGFIDISPGGSTSGELFRGWQHLAFAGIIEGNYSGIAGPLSPSHHLIGQNSPTSKISNVGWALALENNASPPANWPWAYNKDFRRSLHVGVADGFWVENPFLRAEEAWNIDAKLDDGLPGRGAINSYGPLSACTTSANSNDFDGKYRLDNIGINCALVFLIY